VHTQFFCNDRFKVLQCMAMNQAKWKDVPMSKRDIMGSVQFGTNKVGRIMNELKDDYEVEFDSDKTLFKKIDKAIDTISRLRDKTTQTFISKKAQMYTLFSLMFKLYDNQIAYTDELFERFKLFVSAYNCFRNEFNIEFRDGALQKLNEDINKYKLASSEGINKIGNRVIRLEIIYKICVEGDVSIKRNLKELEKIYKAQDEGDKIKFIAFDEEDFTDMSELE